MPSSDPRSGVRGAARRALGLAAALTGGALLPASGGAQVSDPSRQAPSSPPMEATLAAPRSGCGGRLALVEIALRDRRGAPLTGATLTLRDARTRTPFAVQPQELGSGEYRLLDDSALPHVPAGGRALELVVTHGARRIVSRQVIARSTDGCHVVRRAGAEALTVR